MKKVALAKVKDDFSRYLRQAGAEEVIITRHGRAAGILIGFEPEDDWFAYRLEHHPAHDALSGTGACATASQSHGSRPAPTRVRREVENKLRTGLKNPRRSRAA